MIKCKIFGIVKNSLRREKVWTRNHSVLHTRNDIGHFYQIDDNLLNRLDLNHKCFEPTFRPIFQACKSPVSLLLRPVMLELTEHISHLTPNCPNLKYVIYGNESGIGKSSVLFYSMCYATKQNWLLLHFPKAAELLQQQIRLAERNARNPALYDTPIEAVEWLKNFAAQNRQLLEDTQFKTSEEYTWSLRECTPPNTTILNLIEFGCDRIKYASDCIGVIVKEVKKQASDKSFKVMTAIDGVNAYYNSSWVRSETREKLLPNDLVLVRAAKSLLKSDWINSTTVCTVGPEECILDKPLGKRWHKRLKRKIYRKVRLYNEYYYDGPCTPLALLKFEGFHDLDPFIPIEVPKLSDNEFNCLFNFYNDRNWITDDQANLQENRDILKILSGKNPAELSRILAYI